MGPDDAWDLGRPTDPLDPPGSLCHYTTAEAAFGHIVPSNQLRMSPYAAMRDPLDQRIWLTGYMGDFEVDPGYTWDDLESRLHELRSLARLLCFTVDADNEDEASDSPFRRAWSRARLWEQYADRHAGVCLLFHRDEVVARIETELGKDTRPMSGPIRYSERGFTDTAASILDLADTTPDGLNARISDYYVEHERDILFSKTLDWQSEHEFRVTATREHSAETNGDEHHLVSFGSSLKAAILAAACR